MAVTLEQVFVLPQYKLHYAQERVGDMEACLLIACALSEQKVICALGKGTLSFSPHKYLRQTFVAVCKLPNGGAGGVTHMV